MENEQNEVPQVIDQTPPPQEREAREIVPFQAGGGLNAMVPQTPDEYARMARLIIDSGCIPASYGNGSPTEIRAKLIIGLMKSVEIGVPPITGLNGIMIVNNRPSVWGDLAISLIQRSGALAKMEVHQFGPLPTPSNLPIDQWDNGYGYRVLMWRKGQETPYVGEFTVGDARRAGLWLNTKKQPWILYPKDMLFNRARSKAARSGFADALHGMGIVEEERDHAPEHDTAARTQNLLSDEPEEAEIIDVVEGGEE
jgi:hypothetical protein